MEIDKDKIKKRFSEVNEALAETERITSLSDKDLAVKLRKMVKFRNKLVHQYWEVDDKAVLEYARCDLDDFRKFMKAVGRLL
jgi:uncharacterized protein YutE (UPF0331/DUF86 family)